MFCYKYSCNFFNWRCVYIVWPVEHLIKKPPVLTNERQSVVKVKSCTALLLSVLKSVLIYKFLILGTCYPDTLYLREEGSKGPWLLFEAKRGPRAKSFGKHWYRFFTILYIAYINRQNQYDIYVIFWWFLVPTIRVCIWTTLHLEFSYWKLHVMNITNLTFKWPCIVINSYNKTN